jgi:predicted outer membrane repeat protein
MCGRNVLALARPANLIEMRFHDERQFVGAVARSSLVVLPGRLILLTLTIMLTFVSLARGVVYVYAAAEGSGDGSSWANAYTNLQDALASPEDEIWVATGIYRPAPPGGDRNATFQLRSGSALYGGFAGGETNRAQRDSTSNLTILSGDLLGNDGANWTNGSDNSYHVVTATNVDATAVLDGFTITGGNNADFGAGLRLENAAPRLANCVIATNLAGIGGGLSALDSAPLITNCTFQGNLAWSGRGGAIYTQTTTPLTIVIRDCQFIGNQAWVNAGPGDAGAVWSGFDCTLDLSNSLFEKNEARWRFAYGNMAANGGALVVFGAGSRIDRCVFRQNRAHIGGALWIARDTIVANCLFVGNDAYRVSSGEFDYGGYAGAIYAANGTNLITGCTLHANKARSTGGVWVGLGETTIANSILWSNTATEEDAKPTDAQFNGSPKLRHSCVRNLLDPIPGEDPPDPAKYPGCITNAPLFVNEPGPDNIAGNADDDLHLLPNSPCLDAGDNNYIQGWAQLDLARNNRRYDVIAVVDTGSGFAPITDMGAYEMTAPFISTLSNNSDNEIQVEWSSLGAGWNYTLEWKADLAGSNWEPVAPTSIWPVTNTSAVVSTINLGTRGFFRVRAALVPP